MQKRSWTKVVAVVAALLVVVAGIFYATNSTGKKPPIVSMNPAFAEYVGSYTSGVINSGSTVKIGFVQDMVDSVSVGTPTSVKLFTFSPSVRGTTVWLDRRTVEFKPDDRLASGQRYEATFAMSKVREMPKGLEAFEYSFQVIPQNYDVIVSNVKPYVSSELSRVKVEGIVATADMPTTRRSKRYSPQDKKERNLRFSGPMVATVANILSQ